MITFLVQLYSAQAVRWCFLSGSRPIYRRVGTLVARHNDVHGALVAQRMSLVTLWHYADYSSYTLLEHIGTSPLQHAEHHGTL